MPSPYQWDYAGACAPKQPQPHSNATFSVGVFQWLPTAKGGLKRGNVVKRFRGLVRDPEPVYAAARAWIAAREGNAER